MQSSNRHQLRRTSPSGRSSRSNFANNHSNASQGSVGSRCNALQHLRHMLRHNGSCSFRYRSGSGSRPRSSCRTHTSPPAVATVGGQGRSKCCPSGSICHAHRTGWLVHCKCRHGHKKAHSSHLIYSCMCSAPACCPAGISRCARMGWVHS